MLIKLGPSARLALAGLLAVSVSAGAFCQTASAAPMPAAALATHSGPSAIEQIAARHSTRRHVAARHYRNYGHGAAIGAAIAGTALGMMGAAAAANSYDYGYGYPYGYGGPYQYGYGYGYPGPYGAGLGPVIGW